MGGVFCVSVFLSSNFVGGEGAADWEASSVFEWFLSLSFSWGWGEMLRRMGGVFCWGGKVLIVFGMSPPPVTKVIAAKAHRFGWRCLL